MSARISRYLIQTNTPWSDYAHEGCPKAPTSWLWHFILPGGEASFVSLTVQFQSAGQVVKTTDWVQDG